MTTNHSHVRPTYGSAQKEVAFADFLTRYPTFSQTKILDDLRATDYGRLDRENHIYLDYTGGGLYADSQITAHMEMLRKGVFGNPHSHNPTSSAMTELVERARAYVLHYFNADPAEYTVIFTANASNALKLVGEAYPFGPGGHYALCADDHNSVNGIREFAKAKGARVSYLPITGTDLRLDEAALNAVLSEKNGGTPRLLAFPAQSNFSGVKHPLGLIEKARALGWDVLLDAAAFAPTNPLDLSAHRPDFVCLSFYKMFGYPTGVGALIARREALTRLRRPWFAGGTITIASVGGDGHYLVDGEAGFEDGTVNYLTLPAVEIGLRHLDKIGMETIGQRVACLTGWLLDELTALRHSNGQPLVQIHGPQNLMDRGGTLALNLLDPDGGAISSGQVEHLAAKARISLRTGCFCNPGCGETTYAIPRDLMRTFFVGGEGLYFNQLVEIMQERHNISVSAIRVSVGLATNFADVYRLLAFFARFRDRSCADIGEIDVMPQAGYERDAA